MPRPLQVSVKEPKGGLYEDQPFVYCLHIPVATGGGCAGAWEPEAVGMMFLCVYFTKLQSCQGDQHLRRLGLYYHSNVVYNTCGLEAVDICLTPLESLPRAEPEEKNQKIPLAFFLFNEVEHS